MPLIIAALDSEKKRVVSGAAIALSYFGSDANGALPKLEEILETVGDSFTKRKIKHAIESIAINETH